MLLCEVREFVSPVYNSPLSAWLLLGFDEPLWDEWIFTSFNPTFLPNQTFSEITLCALAYEPPALVGPSIPLPPLQGPRQVWPPLPKCTWKYTLTLATLLLVLPYGSALFEDVLHLPRSL